MTATLVTRVSHRIRVGDTVQLRGDGHTGTVDAIGQMFVRVLLHCGVMRYYAPDRLMIVCRAGGGAS